MARDRSAWAVPVEGVTNGRKVSVGGAHACVLDAVGAIRCWGDSTSGQVGNGTEFNIVPAPVAISGSRVYRGMEAQFNHTCGLVSFGVHCWGARALERPAADPVFIAMRGADLIAAAMRPSTTLALGRATGGFSYSGICLMENGSALDCWNGFNGAYPCPQPGTHPCPIDRPALGGVGGGALVGFGASSTNVCALYQQGADASVTRSLYCSCQNESGQLGFGGGACNREGDNFEQLVLRSGELLRDVAVGTSFVCLANALGVVECSGTNVNGELGIAPPSAPRSSFAAVPAIRQWWLDSPASEMQREADRVWATANFACARLVPNGDLSRAELWCWGRNNNGALGQGHSRTTGAPSPVLGLDDQPLRGVVHASLGATSCALLTSGRVLCWGRNGSGQLGAGISPVVTRPRRATLVP